MSKLKVYAGEINYEYSVYPIKIMARSPREAEKLLEEARDKGDIKEGDWSIGTEGVKLLKFEAWMEDDKHKDELITVTKEGVIKPTTNKLPQQREKGKEGTDSNGKTVFDESHLNIKPSDSTPPGDI